MEMPPALTAAKLAEALGLQPESILGDLSAEVRRPRPLEGAAPAGFAFCRWTGADGAAKVRGSSACVIICPPDADDSWRRADQTLIRSANPRQSFASALEHVVVAQVSEPTIHETAVIAASARVDPTATIAAHVVIGEECEVGAGTVVHPNTVIGDRVRIGKRCTIFAGAVLGADGFGYERTEDGEIVKFPHLGGVVVGDDVEIGANTCIDRGTLGDTVIEDEARIDNLVHIAHNVHIQRRAFVIALAMIGGSTVIERDAWVAPGSVLRNGIVVGDRLPGAQRVAPGHIL
jgi:UDP-3-O-[3-hydroxymyristoyl] glucosamine N-acyltransferase